MALIAAVAAPLMASVRVLWARLQVVQDDRAAALQVAAAQERERREQIEALLAEARENRSSA